VKPTRISLPAIILISILALCSGCAETKINTSSFDQFSSDVQQMSKSADQVFASGVTFSQAGYLAELQDSSNFKMTDLILHESDKGFAIPDPQPTFMEIHEAANTLSDANQLLVDYAAALQQLAAPALVSEATFDQMTKDLNSESASVTKALAKLPVAPSASELDFFSGAAVDAAHLFIERRQREDLIKVIEANQPAVEQFSDWCNRGVVHLEQDLHNSYMNQINALSTTLYKVPAGAKRVAAQGSVIKQTVELDTTFLSNEEALNALSNAYEAVPKAHQNLGTAVQSPKGTLADLQTLNRSVRRLQSLSGGAKQTSSPGGSPSPHAPPSPAAPKGK
jgi:hypothetical protein